MNLTQLINNKIFDARLSTIQIDKKYVINTINPHSYVTAKNDLAFQKALMASDILLPDGTGIVLASRVLCGKKIQKIAGADIHQYLLEQANLSSQKIFYLGSSENTLQLIENRIKKEFPNITVASYSPPFKPDFSQEDTDAMVCKINNFRSDILFVGMTAPKQEKWVYFNKDVLTVNTIASVGAVFDFYAGNVPRAPKIMISLGLEWVHRSFKSFRLLKRNFIAIPKFVIEVLKYKFIK